MVIFVGMVGFGFWYATSVRLPSGRAPTASSHPTATPPPAPTPAEPTQRIRRPAEPLTTYPWVIVNAPYAPPVQDSALALPSGDLPLTITQAQLTVDAAGQGHVTATLHHDGPGLLTQVQAQVSLVNAQGLERCRTIVTAGFLQAGDSLVLRADVPPALQPLEPSVKVHVLDYAVLADPILLENVQVQPLADLGVVRLTWPHQASDVLSEITFHLVAQGAEPDQRVAYLVHLMDPRLAQVYIDGSPQVSFDVQVPIDLTWNVVTWRVQAVAR